MPAFFLSGEMAQAIAVVNHLIILLAQAKNLLQVPSGLPGNTNERRGSVNHFSKLLFPVLTPPSAVFLHEIEVMNGENHRNTLTREVGGILMTAMPDIA